jgi:hypothetical protein
MDPLGRILPGEEHDGIGGSFARFTGIDDARLRSVLSAAEQGTCEEN